MCVCVHIYIHIHTYVHRYRYNNRNNQTVYETKHSCQSEKVRSTFSLVMSWTLYISRRCVPRFLQASPEGKPAKGDGLCVSQLGKRWIPNSKQDSLCEIGCTQNWPPCLHSTKFFPLKGVWQSGFSPKTGENRAPKWNRSPFREMNAFKNLLHSPIQNLPKR